ncbi:MAG: LamG-like jellyroll fold domain-containing protein [Candidatus Brocadiia bacterium]
MGNHQMKEKDEQLLLELIHRHIDGGRREEEKRKLERLLNNSAEARRIYVREMKFHASMKEILGGIDFDIFEERLSDELSSDSAQLVPEDGKEAAQKKSPQSEQRPTGAGRHLRRYRATGTRSPWRVMFAVAACLALIVGAFLLNAAFQGNLDRWFGNDRKTAAGSKELAPAVATLQEVVGNVEIRREGATAPASVGLSLQPDDELLIGEQAGATVRVEDGTSIQLRERTRFQFESGKRFHLQRGELDANVVKQSADQEVRFTTPHATAVILGTQIRLLAEPERTRLHVTEGRVKITSPRGRSQIVKAGQNAAVLSDDLAEGLIAYYPFTEGQGPVAFDRSGCGEPLNLELLGRAEWLSGQNGVSVGGESGYLKSQGAARKLHDRITETGRFTVETWVKAQEAMQGGPARIVSYSANERKRNFTVGHGQSLWKEDNNNLAFRLRTTGKGDEKGLPQINVENIFGEQVKHLVVIFDGAKIRIYVDGQKVASKARKGELSNWDDSYSVAVGNEFNASDRGWAGEIYGLSFYDRDLAESEVLEHYESGF